MCIACMHPFPMACLQVTYTPDMGDVQEYFLGSGGLINLYCGLTNETMPGVTEAVAQGNALGKGPVLFCLGSKGLRRLAAAAAAGDPAFQQLELDMYRLAGGCGDRGVKTLVLFFQCCLQHVRGSSGSW